MIMSCNLIFRKFSIFLRFSDIYDLLQIFPLHIKGLGGSMSVLIKWLGAWLVSYTFNFLMSWSCPGKKQSICEVCQFYDALYIYKQFLIES